MRTPSTYASILVTAPIFAVGGALSRYNFRTTETRWQIAGFASLAFGVEVIATLDIGRASLLRGLANAAAAGLIITAVKFHLEPNAKRADAAIVRHASKTLIREATGRR